MPSPIIFTDVLIIVFYVVAILVLGLYFKNSDQTVSEYFLADRKSGWLAVGLSLFATNISSEHLLGLAGGGASRGLAVAQFELIAIFFLIILGWFIAPIYLKSKVITTPEFLGQRFDTANRKFFSGLSIFTYIVTKIFVTLFAAGIVFNKIFGMSIFSTAVVLVFLTGLYTIVGGFKAVVRTQVVQSVLLIISAVIVTVYGLIEVGGISGLHDKIPVEHFQMFKGVSDPDFPWTGIIFGAPIIAFWYWCADHYMVQRVLAAKSVEHARKGTMVTAVLKILPLFILVLPGLIALALFPEIQGDDAYPILISSQIIPYGLKGIVLTGFLAAIMSSLSASFNSIAALYTMDFYKIKNPDASERTLVHIGRMATIAVIFIVLLFVPFIKLMNSHIYIFLQGMQAFISAPISAVFLFGFLMKKINGRGVLIAFVIGEIIGVSRFALEFMSKSGTDLGGILTAFVNINYLHFTVYLFVGTSLLITALSYVFKVKDENIVSRISPETASGFVREESGRVLSVSKRSQMLLSVIILILTLGIWYIFV